MTDQAPKRYHRLTDRALDAVSKFSNTPQMPKEPAALPALSILVVLGTLVTLRHRIKALGLMEIGVSLVFSWQHPALTLCVLLMWSYACFNPHLFIALPFVILLGKELIPNYASTFGLTQVTVDNDEPEFEADDRIMPIEESFDVMAALRTGQAKLQKIVELFDKLDHFIEGPASFKKDPKSSCLLLAGTLFALFLIVFTGRYISLSFVFVATSWIVALVMLPPVKDLNLRPPKPPIEPIRRELEVAKEHICIDDTPLSCTVEVFELQQQGLTPRIWEPRGFSPYVYTTESRIRALQQLPPPSEKDLDDIEPPVGWDFEHKDEWHPASNDWVARRGIKAVKLDGDWAVDVESDWRRRRWVRKCYKQIMAPKDNQ